MRPFRILWQVSHILHMFSWALSCPHPSLFLSASLTAMFSLFRSSGRFQSACTRSTEGQRWHLSTWGDGTYSKVLSFFIHFGVNIIRAIGLLIDFCRTRITHMIYYIMLLQQQLPLSMQSLTPLPLVLLTLPPLVLLLLLLLLLPPPSQW